MRKILIAALAALTAACAPKNPNDTVVHVRVENMTLSNVGLIVDRTSAFTVELDKKGEGTFVLPGMGNIYPIVVYGQQTQPVYIGKGEEVTLRFDGRKFRDGVLVEGPDAPASEYLQTIRMPEPPSYALPWEEFSAALDESRAETVRLMKARKLEERCPRFAAIEEDRLRYLYGQSMLVYPMGHRMMGGDEHYRTEKAVYDAVRELVVEREDLADVAAYREFMQFAVPMLLEEQGAAPEDSYQRTVATMRYIGEHFTNEKVKQTLLRTIAIDYFRNSGIRNTAELQNLANAYITDPQLLQDYREEIARHDLTATGRLSPDFTATDIDGKSHSLGDFAGKYLYIDVWATWCAPCKQQLPYLKALEKQFEGRNIAFLSLSVDKDKAAWEKMVRSGELGGTQLWLSPGSSFQQDYGIDAIPRFILLDKEGVIVNADMLRPSSEDIVRVLNEQEGI